MDQKIIKINNIGLCLNIVYFIVVFGHNAINELFIGLMKYNK